MRSRIKIRVSGRNLKLFFKRLYGMGIYYDHLKVIGNNCIELIISNDDYLRIDKIKTIYNIEKINEYGFIKIIDYLKNNTMIVISFLLSVLLLITINHLVFDVNVIHSDKKIREILFEELDKYGIKKFHFIPRYSKIQTIKNSIINDYNDNIEWLEIAVKGNKIEVRVVPRKTEKVKKDLPNRNVVAKKSGIIMRIDGMKGEILKKKNDYVSKGDIIISGNIMKNDEVKNTLPAEGKVYAEVWYQVNIEYPLYYEETIYLKDVKMNYLFEFLNFKYALRKNYDDSYSEKRIDLINRKLSPFKLYLEKQRKIRKNKQKLTTSEAKDKALKLATKKIESKLAKDEYIISKKALKFYQKDSRIVVDVFFKVCENITEYETINEE